MESLTRPPFHHRRKLSTISSNNGLSYSGKEGYEDLFLVGNKKTKLRRAVSVEDYGEIFGGVGASVSSITVLDLSDFDGPNGSGELRNSNVQVDYSRIFGGSCGDDGPVARPVPPYEELFDGAYKSNNDKAKPRVTAHKESPLKGSDNVKDSYHGEVPEASNQDFDSAKKLNMSYHKTSPHGKNGSNGTKHVAQLNAVPGFAFFVNVDAGMRKQDHDKAISWAQHVNAPPIDQSHPKGNPFYLGELEKSWPSKVSPASSSRALLNTDKVHLNQLESFSLGSKVDSPEKGADDGDLTITTSDEELDVNSAASVSAVALKKVIQQAQESIRIAKEIMEKKQNSMKMHSRCLLKVPDVKETKHVQHIASVTEINVKDACDAVDKDALLVNSKIDSQNQEENVEADGGMSSWFTHMLHNGKNRMGAFVSQLVDKRTDSILPENSNQLQDTKTAKPETETSKKNNPEKGDTVDRRDAVSELKTFDTATYFSTNGISVPVMLVKDGNLTTQVDEECLQTRLNQGTSNKNGHEAKDCGHESVTEIIENEDIDVTTEHKDDGFSEGKIVEEDKGISETSALPKYANENHLNGSIDSCDSDDISIPSEDFELCGLEVKNSLTDNILAGHEKKACQLEALKTKANNDLVGQEKEKENENENENENVVEDEIEEASRLKESEVCETSYYLNRSNGEDSCLEAIGANSEGHRDLECEEDRKQVESELDRSNEERDVLEIIDGKNETNDDLECGVDEKEVEDEERSYLDQNIVQGDDVVTIVEDVFEALLASDSKTDTIHEELMHGQQLNDVDQVETSAFIYVGIEERGIKNDMNDNPPPREEYPPTVCFIDKNDGEKNVDSLNFVLGPEKTIGMVHECSTEDVDTSKRGGEKDNHVDDHPEKDRVEENVEPKSDMPNIYEEIDSVLKTGQGMEWSEENHNRSETVSGEIVEAKQKETDIDNYHKNILAIKREKERQKDKIAVESAMREARDRAFVEARERAAVDKANAEARQRATESWEKLEKVASRAKLSTDKASVEAAKLKADHAAVDRATEEARERALEKAMSQKTGTEPRYSGSKNTGMKHSVSSPDLRSIEENNNESVQRRKARLERHERIMERAAKALAEKNMRDILAQREQSERNRIAEPLNAEIKRWSSGKEGNLRALLSTLQYILGVNSGWQPITLTEIITTSAVKKAYKKATLYVHPDKLQQKGASIQHKYICEKVFDLLQAARNKFNSEER